jgi:sugar phosphate isomerase/epimerase
MRRGFLADFERHPGGLLDVRFGVGSVVDSLPAARKAGFSAMEIYTDTPIADPGERAYIMEFSRKAVGAGTGIYSVHVPYKKDISVADEGERTAALDGIRQTIETAAMAGARFVVVHPGSLAGKEEMASRIDRSVAGLLLLSRFCGEFGIGMAVENMLPGHVGEGANGLAAIMDRLPRGVGVCLDAGHAFITGGSPAKAATTLGGRIKTLHVHDNDGKSDLHQIPGDGGIDWRGFVDALVGCGFNGVFMLEIGARAPTLDQLRKAGAFCDAHLPPDP